MISEMSYGIARAQQKLINNNYNYDIIFSKMNRKHELLKISYKILDSQLNKSTV